MLDRVLAVAVVLLPTLFAVGIEVVSKEIKEHPSWRAAVLLFGIGLSVLTGFQITRADRLHSKELSESAATQRELKGELDQSLLNQQYTKGQLDSLAMMVGKWSQPGSGNSELAAAIKQIMTSGAQNVSDLKMPNAELCKRAHAKAQEIREFIAQKDQTAKEEREQYFTKMQQAPLGPARDALWAEMSKHEDRNYENNRREFTNKYLADMKYLRDLIIERLPSQLADTVRSQNGTAESSLEVGEPVGFFNANEMVTYLEVLANALCPKKH
jgi:hypothetical protein